MYVRVKNLLNVLSPRTPRATQGDLVNNNNNKRNKKNMLKYGRNYCQKLIKIFASHVTNRKCVRHSKM